MWVWHVQNFVKRIFAGGTQTMKSVKVLALCHTVLVLWIISTLLEKRCYFNTFRGAIVVWFIFDTLGCSSFDTPYGAALAPNGCYHNPMRVLPQHPNLWPPPHPHPTCPRSLQFFG